MAMARILIVDDEALILRSLSRELSRAGYDVDTCANPAESLLLLEQKSYDAVIADYQMPGINGVQLLQEVRRLDPLIARLMLTGKGDINTAMAAVNEAGACRFLTKPWDSEAMLADLGAAISARRRQAADSALADMVRAKRDRRVREARELSQLRKAHPELVDVNRAADGAIILDESM